MDISQEFRERVLEALERLERQQQDQNNDIKELRKELRTDITDLRTDITDLRKDISDIRVSQAKVEQKLDDTLTQRRGRWVNVGIVAAVVGVIVSLIKSFFFS